MIIHEHGVSKIFGQLYEYTFKQGVNEVTVAFSVKPGEKPETGDMVIGNRLVKKEEGRE